MKRSCILLAIALLATVAIAQPPPETSAPEATVEVAAESATESVEVRIDAPLSAPDVEALAESAADSAEAVSSGDSTIAEATRDPADAPDPGAGSMFWILSLVFGGAIRPVVNVLVDKVAAVDPRLSGALNTTVVIAFYLGAWALLAKSNPGLPQDGISWVIAGFAATGVGSAVSSGVRTMAGRRDK